MENTIVEIEGGPKWNVWTSVEHVHSSLLSTSRFGKGKQQEIFKPPPTPIKPPKEFEVDDTPIDLYETTPVYSRAADDQILYNELNNIRSGLYRNETIEQHYSMVNVNGSSLNGSSGDSSVNEGSNSGSRIDESESSSIIDPTDDDMICFGPGNCFKSYLASSSSISSRLGTDCNDTQENSSSAEDMKPESLEKVLPWSEVETDPKPAETPAAPPVAVKRPRPKIRNALLSSLLAKQESQKTESLPKEPECNIELKAPEDFEKPVGTTVQCPAGFEDFYDYKEDDSIDEETKALITILNDSSPPQSFLESSSLPPVSETSTISVKPAPSFAQVSIRSSLNVFAEPYVPKLAPTPFVLNNSDFPPL